jgi:myosin heavy subunit
MASSSRSIGSLFIDIEARTAKLETDMAKAKSIIDRSTGSVKDMSDATTKLRDHQNVMLNQLTQRLAGMFAVFTILKSEVMHVYNNIEKIPGIPPQTIASIQGAKENMAKFREVTDGAIAAGIAGFLDFGKAIGHAMATQGQGVYESPHEAVAAELRRRNEVTDILQITELEKRLKDQKRDTALAAMKTSDQVRELLAYATELDKRAAPGGSQGVRLAQLQAELAALKARETANEKIKNLDDQRRTASEKLSRAEGLETEALLSKTESVKKLRAELERLQALRPLGLIPGTKADYDITNADGSFMKSRPLTAEEKEKDIKLLDAITAAQYRLNSAIKAAGQLARDMGNAMSASLGEALLSGEKLRSVLDKLLGTLLQIVLQRAILSPLADIFTAGLGKLPGMGAKAGGGPINGATLVGEKGPEILVGNAYGTVIPNEQIGRGSKGNNYYIDASGADASAISRLESMLLTLAGPGVVERRSLTANMNAARRRGAVGAALQGA